MPAYSRNSGAWENTIFRKRQDAAWSGDDALGFVRDGGAWVQFQAPIGDALGQPINLVAVPGDLEASFTWTNDLADGVDADNARVQYRIPQTTGVWTEEIYPITSTAFAFLNAATDYHFQVRYITRDPDDGTIDATGPITEVFFTTLALTGPGIPAEDPGGTGGESIVEWPVLPGGGTVGGSGCWYEYIVQDATTPASGAITWADTAVTGSFDGDAGSLSIDFATEGIACGELIRFKYRENCNGVTGDYQFGDAFVHVCDWDAACGGVPASTQLNTGLYVDANCLFAFPEACGTIIRDTITTSIELGKLPGFGSIQTFDGPHTVYGKTTNGTLGKPTLAGKFGSLALLVDGDDFSCGVRVRLEEVPGGSGGGGGTAPASFPVVRFGRNVAISVLFSTTTTFKARCSWLDATGSFQSVTSTSSFALDEFHTITLTMDANGDKILYVNGVAEDTNADTTAMAFSDAGIGQDVEVYTNEFMRFRAVAAWDRVLSAAEVAGLDEAPTPTLVHSEAGVLSATSGSIIEFPLPAEAEAGHLAILQFEHITTGTLITTRLSDDWLPLGAGRYKVLDGTETGVSFGPTSAITDGRYFWAIYSGFDTGDWVGSNAAHRSSSATSINQCLMQSMNCDGLNEVPITLCVIGIKPTAGSPLTIPSTGAMDSADWVDDSLTISGKPIFFANVPDWHLTDKGGAYAGTLNNTVASGSAQVPSLNSGGNPTIGTIPILGQRTAKQRSEVRMTKNFYVGAGSAGTRDLSLSLQPAETWYDSPNDVMIVAIDTSVITVNTLSSDWTLKATSVGETTYNVYARRCGDYVNTDLGINYTVALSSRVINIWVLRNTSVADLDIEMHYDTDDGLVVPSGSNASPAPTITTVTPNTTDDTLFCMIGQSNGTGRTVVDDAGVWSYGELSSRGTTSQTPQFMVFGYRPTSLSPVTLPDVTNSTAATPVKSAWITIAATPSNQHAYRFILRGRPSNAYYGDDGAGTAYIQSAVSGYISVDNPTGSVEVAVVGGGGSAPGGGQQGGAAGGAIQTGTRTLSEATVVQVGRAAIGGTSNINGGEDGGETVFGDLVGGAGGGSLWNTSGAGGSNVDYAGAAGTPDSGRRIGGGGAGSGGDGALGDSVGNVTGDGGVGTVITLTGVSQELGAGGVGGAYDGTWTAGTGSADRLVAGLGGGADGRITTSTSIDGFDGQTGSVTIAWSGT